ncbi:MAG: nucleotidyl transferase AbiEii/AbiGii toxin family protein [Symploca sp. SIO2E6]|nr:nucleotidyl transferase AbiEii/AbiGii toxin family protein [Symploca sp. SIO2E6]
MQIIAALTTVNTSELRLVFSGGTSLSKGFGLIQRFSEDLDFKVILPESGFNRNKCRSYRRQLVDAIRKGSSQWSLNDNDIFSRNQGRFFYCQIGYQCNFALVTTLRPHIKLEISFKSPALPVEEKSLQSFIAQALGNQPEVPAIACVSPIETAADKLSALTWRVLSQQLGNKLDDPALIRHLHDLTALEILLTEYHDFPNLIITLLEEDVGRDKDLNLLAIPPIERLFLMLQYLEDDPVYADEYERFVTSMSYATEDERPSFRQALDSAHRIVSRIDE